MINLTHELPVTHQTEIPNVTRGSLYYLPKQASHNLCFIIPLQRLIVRLNHHSHDIIVFCIAPAIQAFRTL